MQTFEFHRPHSLAEASALLQAAPEARLLAGGMTLIPSMKLRLAAPSALIDLSGITALRGIQVGEDVISVGAMTRHVEVAGSAALRGAIPALAQLAGGIGDPQVRNRGTIGGSLAANDPAADYPAAVLGLDASIITSRRTITADSFFRGMFETALGPDEVISGVRFPLPRMAAYEKFRSPASRYALVGVFVARTNAGVRVAVTGAAPCVFRATTIESVLTEKFSPDALSRVRYPATGLNADLHGDAQFRAHLIGVLTRRAVEKMLADGQAR